MTEHNSGSHLLGMQTTATPCQNGWIINGAKRFIGNSHIATVHGVIARTSSANNRNSLTAFAIPAESPGVVLGEEHGLSGLQGFSLGEIKFHNCFVPDSHRIGQVGEGLRLAHQVVAHHGKPNISALAIGLHARILDRLLEYTAGRKLYGNPIATLPAIERVITEIYSKLYTSRVLMHDAASNLDRGINNELGIGIAKLTASDNAINAALQATRAMGAIGNHPELGIVQSLMDALMTSAPSGTEEVIMKRIFEHINRVEARV
ncbi:MAG: acyl-CoA dehydrogenase [Corynebacterium sp.]|uniref:acyl-CoA dehydrogenase n=1 Tax=Corynebacterium sp. TaxID=1720 RepID=UPI0026DB5447|nr:acyl-CoA dehydrogenase [Corynebacterium sp.]MDO4762029.1 acyl-CoA dehydrogenase [Corynebacterium sp.]